MRRPCTSPSGRSGTPTWRDAPAPARRRRAALRGRRLASADRPPAVRARPQRIAVRDRDGVRTRALADAARRPGRGRTRRPLRLLAADDDRRTPAGDRAAAAARRPRRRSPLDRLRRRDRPGHAGDGRRAMPGGDRRGARRPGDRLRVNSALATLSGFARLAGGPLGGIVFGLGGLDAVVATDAASFLLAAAILAPGGPRPATGRITGSVSGAAREGLRI